MSRSSFFLMLGVTALLFSSNAESEMVYVWLFLAGVDFGVAIASF